MVIGNQSEKKRSFAKSLRSFSFVFIIIVRQSPSSEIGFFFASETKFQRSEPTQVYQVDSKVLVSYLHLTCDFTMLGITRDSFVDKTLNIFKSVPICDVLENWRLLVADENKTFNSKCEEILCILRYLQKESSMQRRETIAQVSKDTTTSPLFPSHVQGKFCFASQMCLNQNQPVFECTFYRINSYLCNNDEISVFLQNLGIAQDFEPIFYKRFIENCESIENEVQAIQVRDILEYLRSHKEKVGKLPDDNDKFRNVEELCLNDFQLKESLTEISPLHCHRIIPHDLALFFGVKTKRSMLETMSSDPSFESFSQKEDLCNRLYRITTNYSNPMDIFKELIQNADDAHASEIQFILDDRNLPKQRVINDNWEKLLEPALLVFNDAFFTNDDIKGIKDLGRGSKGDDVHKIGQFGVGFNCVFSITDHPCFLTQVDGQGPGNMCLLDPSCQITPHQGKKININQDLLKNFPDSFGCFLSQNRKLDGRKGKTMFRLPLRQKESSLGKMAPNSSEMYEKLQQLAAKVPEYLLFLRNIKTIRISRTNPAGNLTELAAFSKNIDKLTAELSRVQIDSISSRSKKVSEWLLNEREFLSQQIPSIVHRSLLLRDLKLREYGAVAFPLFLDGSLKDKVPGVYCYLPIEEASAHLRDESVGIPVVVNGQFFLDESRRMLSLQPQEPKGAWNIHVLQHIVGPAYGALIRYFTSTIKKQIAPDDSIHYFLSMLPKLRASSQLAPKSMQSNLGYYISLGMMRFNAEYAWIPRVNTDRKIVDFLNLASIRNLMVSNGQTNNKDFVLYKISSALDIPLTQIGPEYVKCWTQVGISMTSLSPNDVISKLADAYFQPTRIEETAYENSSNLVIFLNWSKKELSAHPDPNSLPIFLSANGILQRNTANKLYSSALSIADIFPQIRDRILDIDVDRCLRSLEIACNLKVDEFFAYIASHFKQILVDQLVCWSEVMGEINERWVRLVWDFLAHHQKEILERFRVVLEKMSILLCFDKRGILKLMPLSVSTDYVFASFLTIRIGTVSINTKDYSSFYRISDELNHFGTQRKAFASKFIMPSILTVERHLHILHVINKENQFDKFSESQRKQLYTYFRDSFCNDQSIFRTNELDKLRQLPIFSFVKSTIGCQPLSAFSSVISMSLNVPLVGLTLAENEANIVLVYKEATIQGAVFQEKLGVESKSVSELYSIFIPKFFSQMKKNEMKFHFQYLERELSFMKQADRNLLKYALEKTQILTDECGNKVALESVAQIELRNMVGYLVPITDFSAVGIVKNGYVDKLVGAYKFPAVSAIVSNWKKLTEDSSKEFDLKCSEIREIIVYLARKLDKGPYEEVADALRKQNLLPANDVNQFCKSSSICLNENAPIYNGHLYRVNFLITKAFQNLNSKQFLRNCKVVDHFAPSEYSELINSFQTVESPEQIQQIVSILLFICKGDADIRQLPDTYSIMRPIDELCLNDLELSSNALEDSLNFCHEALPHQLCNKFGVKTKRSKLKMMHSDHRFESFFQREDINKRLARIAESYSNPMDIFKELIQNADDAQATQVHFILDKRILPAKHVIDHGFEKLLDPALLVYNNVPFKTSDIEGIQRVGSGSKGDDVEKIGQFGVGFNCVYSLTDFPCFLTQVDGVGLGNLLLLDPQGVIMEVGGCKIDVSSETYMEAFKDSFNCFLRENEQMDATNGGSMFRFPLRVRRSKLGNSAPKLDEIEKKMNEFSSKIAEYLLFVNNITSIKVSVLKETGTMRCLGAFSKTFPGDNEIALREFRSHTRQFLSVSYQHELLTKRNIIYNVDIIDDIQGKKIAAWIVSEQLGSERSVPDIIRESTTGKYKIKQHASVAFPFFLDGSLKNEVPGVYCYLPVEEASSQLKNESVKIPVVINGQFFLDESRRMISLQPQEPKGAWNIHVLQDIVGPAYAKILEQFIGDCISLRSSFQLQIFLDKLPCCRDENLTLTPSNNIASFVTRGFLCEMNKFNWIPCMSFELELLDFESVTCAKNFSYLISDHLYLITDHLSSSIYRTSQNLGVKITQIPLKYTIVWACYGKPLSKLTPTDIIGLLRKLPDNPLKIEQSVFNSVQNLAVFLNWSSAELLKLSSADDLPIYLTADGFLLKNSSIQLYSSALSVAQIFPQLNNRILHHEIDQLLKKLKITCEMNLEEFLDYLKKYNPDYCQNKVIKVNRGEIYQKSRWVELVWNFLHARINPDVLVTDSIFDNFSLLLCTDKYGSTFLRPISAGKNDTFLNFYVLSFGSVRIRTAKYSGLYNLVDSLKNEDFPSSKLVASAVLSKDLHIKQQIMILHLIKNEFDFNNSEPEQLYEYFKNVFQNDTSSIDQESINYLRELPIFAIIPDQVDNLLGGLCVYSVPREIPRQGLNLSASVAYKYVNEEKTPEAIEFQKRLGIINFTTTQMYVETIIPLLFERFEFDDLSVHLNFISEILPRLYIDNQKVILICLSQCKFIHANNDDKREPKYFYDSRCPLFPVFKDGDQLLPRQYFKFRDLLSKCGFNHKVTEEDFWDFITLHSANPCRENSSRILYHFLKSFSDLKLSPNEFSKVGRLPIFETHKHGYQKLSDVYLSQHKTLVEFVEPVLNSDTSGLLQAKCTHYKSFWQIWLDQENSGLEKKPTAAIVLKNLEKLIQCESLNDSKIFECLRFITKEASSGSQVDRNILEKLSCIPCVRSGNGKLLPPRQICKSIECLAWHRLFEGPNISEQNHCELETYVNEPSPLFMGGWDHLQILGATKSVTLQQTVFAIHQFYGVVMRGDIWNKNPNSLNRFYWLKDHFEELLVKKPSDLSSLSSECPLYDITIEGKLVDISGAVVIDKPSLYRSLQESSRGTESHFQDDFTRLFPDSSVIDVNSLYAENLKLLPAPLRPKFFSEICQIEIDSSTFEESNSAAEQFHLERISAKLQSDLFIEKLAHVLEHREKLVQNYLSQNESRNHKKFETQRLAFLKNSMLRPVKRLNYRYTIDINGREMNGIVEREFEYQENPNPEIFFTFPDISSGIQSQGAKKLFKEITKRLFVPEKLDCHQLDTKVTKFLAKLIFVCQSEIEEQDLLCKYNIPSFNRVSIAKDSRDLLVGNIVPLASCALIDYSTDRKIVSGDIVAIQENSDNKHEPVFKYAKYVGEVQDSNDSSDPSVRCLLFRIQVDRDTILNLNPKQVFTFLDKLDTGTNESQEPSIDEGTEEEQFERDVMNIRQIIWTAVTSQKPGERLDSNMDDLERRLLQSYLRKYSSPDQQQRLIRVVSESIRTEKEAHNIEPVAEVGDARRTTSQIQQPEPDMEVNNFLELNFERMNREINAHTEQLKVHKKRKNHGTFHTESFRRPQSSLNGRGNSFDSFLGIQFHIEALTQPQPNPTLAKLWLKQATEHWMFLSGKVEEDGGTNQESHRNWMLEISLKVSFFKFISQLKTSKREGAASALLVA